MSRPEKARLITLIHVARAELQIDDATYRKIVSENASGKMSAGSCSQWELEKIFAHMKKCGFKIRKPAKAQPPESRPLNTEAEASKVRALWLLLAEIGAVKNSSEGALASYVKRMTGVDDMKWIQRGEDFTKVIESLKKWACRTLPAAIDARLGALRESEEAPAWLTRGVLLSRVRGNRRGDTYDVLNDAWSAITTKGLPILEDF